METPISREPIEVTTDSTTRLSRLDEILAREQRRRFQTVAVLVLLTVICGASLAI